MRRGIAIPEDAKDLINKASKIVKRVKLTPKNMDSFEECEIIADLMDDEMVMQIDDEDLRGLIQKMRRMHLEVRRINYAAYIDTAREIFGRIADRSSVLQYHQAEQLVERISDEDINKIKDPELRETLFCLRHIHDNIAEKKANVIRRIKLY